MELLEGCEHKFLVFKHANGVIGLHSHLNGCESGIDCGATRVNQLRLQGVLSDTVLHGVRVIIL